MSEHNIGACYAALGHHEKALEHYQRAAAIHGEVSPTHRFVFESRGAVGLTLVRMGRAREGLKLTGRALKEAEVSLGPNHPGLALLLRNHTEATVEAGKGASALELLRRLEKKVTSDSTKEERAAVLVLAGRALANLRRYAQAVEKLGSALELMQEDGATRKALGEVAFLLATAQERLGRTTQARSLAIEAQGHFQASGQTGQAHLVTVSSWLGRKRR
jgi:tetratricopeptide (TPR) repeat protein